MRIDWTCPKCNTVYHEKYSYDIYGEGIVLEIISQDHIILKIKCHKFDCEYIYKIPLITGNRIQNVFLEK